MGRKKSKKSVKAVDSAQVLFVCGIGMIAIIVGVFLLGLVQSYLTPSIEVGKPEVVKVVKTEAGNSYELEVLIKNPEKKSAKAELVVELGFDTYRMRHAHGTKSNFYRFFQVLKEVHADVQLPAGSEQKLQYKLDLEQDVYMKFELNSETTIYPYVVTKKVTWL